MAPPSNSAPDALDRIAHQYGSSGQPDALDPQGYQDKFSEGAVGSLLGALGKGPK